MEIFNYDKNEVRVTTLNNEPWFVAKDVCDVLGISKHRDAVSRLDDDERESALVDTLGGNQEMTVINEAGLYSLILRSRKPEAKAFKRWVTHDVIPSIRKHGMYATDDLLNNPDLLIQVATKLKEERQARLEVESKLQIAQPKADVYDDFMSAENHLTVTQVAKSLGWGRNNLFKFLRERGILDRYNAPMQRYINSGYFSTKAGTRNNINYTQTLVSPKGHEYIRNLVKQN